VRSPNCAGRKVDPRVRRAVEALQSEDLFLSVISVGEIAKGIALLPESKKKNALRTWMRALEAHYADRVLDIDLETTHIWGEITAAAQRAGKIVPASDGLIAATAHRHGLHVMTRNTEHFKATHAMILDPWAEQTA
jgi:predicted nucleic acid-binding protein